MKDKTDDAGGLEIEIGSVLQSTPGDCRCPKVLCVDDNPFNLHMLTSLFQILNILPETAINGQDALVKFKRRLSKQCGRRCKMYSLIFMDIDMPLLNGFETTQEIRKIQERRGLPHIPIIVNSAYTDGDDIQKCFISGADHFLAKPLSLADIRRVVNRQSQCLQ